MDDTSIRTTRPGSGPHGDYEMTPWRTGAYFIQRAFYSGDCRGHGLKYQHLLLSNRLFGSVLGASRIHNNMGIAYMSGLENFMMAVLDKDAHGNLPCALAYGIFNESAI